MLLDGSKHGQGQAHEDEAEDDGVVAESSLATGSLQKVVDDCLSFLNSGISSGSFEFDWFAQETGSLLIVSGGYRLQKSISYQDQRT